MFHDPEIVKHQPKKCCILITKLLFLLTQGEKFTSQEATSVFFSVTHLFQASDVRRRDGSWWWSRGKSRWHGA